MLDLHDMNIPTDAQFNTEHVKIINNVPNNKQFWFKATQLTTSIVPLPLAVLVPAFLVLDSFNSNIDAVVLFEWVIPMDLPLPAAIKELLPSFLKAAVVKTMVDKNNIKRDNDIFYMQPSALAMKWKSICLKQVLPALFFTTPPTTAAALIT